MPPLWFWKVTLPPWSLGQQRALNLSYEDSKARRIQCSIPIRFVNTGLNHSCDDAILHRDDWETSEALAIEKYELIEDLLLNAMSSDVAAQAKTITVVDDLAQQHQALVVPSCSLSLGWLLTCICLSSCLANCQMFWVTHCSFVLSRLFSFELCCQELDKSRHPLLLLPIFASIELAYLPKMYIHKCSS